MTKLSLDSTFVSGNGKRTAVPIEALQVGTRVWEELIGSFQNCGYDSFVELVRIRFKPDEVLGGLSHVWMMSVTCVIAIQFVDLHAMSHKEEQKDCILSLPSMNASSEVASTYVNETVDSLRDDIHCSVGQILSVCKRGKVRLLQGHKVLEPT